MFDHVLAPLKELLNSKWPRFVLRMILAVLCFVIAFILIFIPGPAFLFWIVGFLLLGFNVGQILMALQRTNDWVRKKVPLMWWLPRFKDSHMRAVMRNKWIQWLDKLSETREARRQRKVERRARRAARKNVSGV